VDEALDDPQVRARDMIVELAHPVFGMLRQVGSPIKIDGVAHDYRPASALGADTASLLDEVGVDAAERDWLRDQGVI
jgi:crotonobetainyl-CoA:carnitine CoA-transferase CaiB-like acyl-CoA transferase